eukprot:Awhi_evm1s4155
MISMSCTISLQRFKFVFLIVNRQVSTSDLGNAGAVLSNLPMPSNQEIYFTVVYPCNVERQIVVLHNSITNKSLNDTY